MGRQGWGPHSKQSRWRIMLPRAVKLQFYMWANKQAFPLKYQAWHLMISYNVFCPQYSNEVKEPGDVGILLLLCLFCYCEILFPKTRWTLTELQLNLIVSYRHYWNSDSCCLLERQLLRKYQPKSEATAGHTRAIPNHISVVTSTSLAENKQHNA